MHDKIPIYMPKFNVPIQILIGLFDFVCSNTLISRYSNKFVIIHITIYFVFGSPSFDICIQNKNDENTRE